MALSLSAPALAVNRYSMEKREKESTLPYTFGDLAAARLAVYGILDGRFRTPQPETAEPFSRLDAVNILWNAFAEDAVNENNGSTAEEYHSTTRAVMGAFSDVPAEFTEQVSWAYQNGIAEGLTDTEFGVYNITETAFAVMLLNTLGYQGRFEYPYALDFAESIGLVPLGLSRNFTLGDAALYLQSAMELKMADGTAVRERMNIPTKLEQTTFPVTIHLTPLFPENMEVQLQEATKFLPEAVEIGGEYLSKDDVLAFYTRYYDAMGENWYTSRVLEEYPLYINVDTLKYEQLPEDEQAEFTAVTDALRRDWSAGKISDLEYMTRDDMECASRLYSGKGLTVYFDYNEAWELACDLDDAFTLYVDDRITQRADDFYQRHFAIAETDKEKVYAAKNAINYKAEYASPVGHDEYGDYYAPDAHSILGFFDRGRIVCDGYASVFQYLMIRAGLDCVVVIGSTVSRQDAENGGGNHAWNKVKVDGVWYNMDVCWSDTGWPYTFDLKSDEFYAGRSHWATAYSYL